MEAGGGFFVLLESARDFDPAAIGKALAKSKGILLTDAARQARISRGVIGERLSEEAALSLAQALKEAGVACRLAEARSLAPPPAPRETARLDLPMDWGRIKAICAASISVERIVQAPQEGPDVAKKVLRAGIMMVTGIPLPMGGKKKAPEPKKASEDLLFMDVLLEGPPERLRINSDHFDYSCLKDEMTYAGAINFKKLLALMSREAPGALLGPGASALMENKSIRQSGPESLDQIERECLWLWALGQTPSGT